MASPKYIFRFVEGEDFTDANPIWPASLSKVYEKESGQQFYREKLSGELTFLGQDFDYIMSKEFDDTIFVTIMSGESQGSLSEYFKGKFVRTDCKINEQDKIIKVSLETVDDYSEVLAGLDKEFDLISLAPEIQEIGITKRPAFQFYVSGDSVVTTYVAGGIYFEQEAEPTVDANKLEQCHFTNYATLKKIIIQGAKDPHQILNSSFPLDVDYTQETITLTGEYYIKAIEHYWCICKGQDSKILWVREIDLSDEYRGFEGEYRGASVDYPIFVEWLNKTIYARVLTDLENIDGNTTYPIPAEDIVSSDKGYKYVIGLSSGENPYLIIGPTLSDSPTEWGLCQPGLYYVKPEIPPSVGDDRILVPIGKAQWTRSSLWWYPSLYIGNPAVGQTGWDAKASKKYTLKHSYSLASCINVLLQQISSGSVTFEASPEFSEFLYGNSVPLIGQFFKPFITPSSNILAGEYEQPAQKALCTLSSILEMLRNCFQCWWFIEDGKLRIEHILWFKKGGKYTGTPDYETDMTKSISLRSHKPWIWGQGLYQYDKSVLPERYQFSWANDSSVPFNGNPIEIISKFVQLGNIEEVTVSGFVSDIDLMLANPGAFSQDTFTLLLPLPENNGFNLPVVSFEGNTYIRPYSLQNGYASFLNLQSLYLYDVPANKIILNGESRTIPGDINLKRSRKQTITIPGGEGFNPYKLIKTDLGIGSAAKIEINLSSQMAKIDLELPPY